jgi:hypothetical protein
MASQALTRVQCLEYLFMAVEQKGAHKVIECLIDEQSVPALNRICKTIRDRLGVKMKVDLLVQALSKFFTPEVATGLAADARQANPEMCAGAGERRVDDLGALLFWCFRRWEEIKNQQKDAAG